MSHVETRAKDEETAPQKLRQLKEIVKLLMPMKYSKHSGSPRTTFRQSESVEKAPITTADVVLGASSPLISAPCSSGSNSPVFEG